MAEPTQVEINAQMSRAADTMAKFCEARTLELATDQIARALAEAAAEAAAAERKTCAIIVENHHIMGDRRGEVTAKIADAIRARRP